MGIGVFYITTNAMQSEKVEALYETCQKWFQDSQLRTIISKIDPIMQRKGSLIDQVGAIEVRSPSAVARFDANAQNVMIYKLDFPGIPQQEPVEKISFVQMVSLLTFIEAKK